jgi:hypothetical protein
MPQKEKQQGTDDSGVLIAGVIQGVIRGCCLTLEVFLHSGFGNAYIGSGFAGVITIYLFIACFPNDNQRPLFALMAVYSCAWALWLIMAVVRGLRGRDHVHSRYTGQPWLQRLLPTVTEETIKHLEGIAAFGIGFLVRRLNTPLGDYLLTASAIMVLRGGWMAASLRRQVTEMNDMVAEQTVVAERFRKMQERRLDH